MEAKSGAKNEYAVLERLDKLVNLSLRSWTGLHKSWGLTTNKFCYIQHYLEPAAWCKEKLAKMQKAKRLFTTVLH